MKTAKQINDPQCGEVVFAANAAAAPIINRRFEAFGIKILTICSHCHEEIEGEPWIIAGKEDRYCVGCAYTLARTAKSKRGKAKS